MCVLAPRQYLVFFGAYLVLIFAGFLYVAFFSSVGCSSRGCFPKFSVSQIGMF